MLQAHTKVKKQNKKKNGTLPTMLDSIRNYIFKIFLKKKEREEGNYARPGTFFPSLTNAHFASESKFQTFKVAIFGPNGS